MIIEKVEYSSRLNLIKVFISDEAFLLSYDFFNKYDLKKNCPIEFSLYKKIVSEDDFNRCKEEALRQISYSSKTSFELKNLLEKKDFDPSNIDMVIEFLEAYKLIDDESYVRAFVNDKWNISNWSKGKIRFKLRGKNVSDFLIDKYLGEISDEDEYERALDLAKRKSSGKSDYKTKQKVYNFLSYRAYSYDIIRRCLDEIFYE